jgi:hypothetical protein
MVFTPQSGAPKIAPTLAHFGAAARRGAPHSQSEGRKAEEHGPIMSAVL